MLEVVRISTLVCCLILSISVRRAFTTLTASLHSKPDPEFFLAAVRDSTSSMRTHTKVLELFTLLLISSNTPSSNLLDWITRIVSFCARALQRLVLPVPGGPWRRTTLLTPTRTGSTFFSARKRLV